MKLSNILFRRLAFRLGLLLIVGAVTVTARAEWDHQLRFSGRTYPRGASFDWKSGFTQVLWDRRASSEQDWNYGFVRPVVDIQTIGLAMRPQGRLLRRVSGVSLGLVAAAVVNAALVYLGGA